MKFKNKMFLDEGDATRLALYLRSNSIKSKLSLFKKMGHQARLKAIEIEREQGCNHKFVDSNVCLKCGWLPE